MELFVFLLILLSGISLIVFGLLNYASINNGEYQNEKFSFLNQFPYELTSNDTSKYQLLVKLLAAIFGGSFAVFGIYQFIGLNMYGAKIVNDYVLGVIYILIGVSIFLEFVWTLKDYKKHIITSASMFSLTIGLCFYLGYFVIVDPRLTFHSSLIYICFGLGLILLVTLIVLPFKKWMYLEKKEEDGSISYQRKKVAILPFTEWMFILINIIICLIICMY